MERLGVASRSYIHAARLPAGEGGSTRPAMRRGAASGSEAKLAQTQAASTCGRSVAVLDCLKGAGPTGTVPACPAAVADRRPPGARYRVVGTASLGGQACSDRH